MESLDFKTFLSSTHPFEHLTSFEFEKVLDSIDIEYFKANQKILTRGKSPEFFYIIAKGVVKEIDEKEEEHFYSSRDSFDVKAISSKNLKSEFIAIEESIIFTIPKELFLEIMNKNEKFSNYFLQDITSKINSLLQKDVNKDLSSFMVAKIEDSYIHQAIFIDENESIYEAVKKMTEYKTTSIFINFKSGEVGIVTDSDLRKKVILATKNYSDPVGEIASTNLITIDKSDFLYNALLLMTEYSLKRLIVTKESTIIGTIEQVDLLSAFSHKSHLINLRIKKAKNIDDIKVVTKDLTHVLTSLQDRGVKVRHITKLVNQLNSKIYEKVYTLIFPSEVRNNSALMILGSEGRGEQTLKTDQDNALILRDGFEYKDLQKYTSEFSEALQYCGFPKCKGNIMVSNPYWSKPLTKYKDDLFIMIDKPTSENVMNLAILFDASFVGGDKALFNSFREIMFKTIESHPTILANFAKATLSFETPLGLFKNFILNKKEHKDEFDLKKGAIFPIVHGIRSLSLQYKISKSNTTQRIKELNNLEVINREFAGELIEAFNFLLTLRLSSQLTKQKQNLEVDNYINPKSLTKLERDLLIDVLKLVDKFKKFISYHFKLNMVS